MMPNSRARNVMAAVVVGAALTSPSSASAAPPPDEAVTDIARYCHACWRNARLHPDSWSDCTQEVLLRLLGRVAPDKWAGLLKHDESEERKEFLRAIDAVKKRTQRARKLTGFADDVADRRTAPEAHRAERREAVDRAADGLLSDRQKSIIALTCDGYSVPEIADELATTVERVSDEKYKAIRKLRKQLA